LRKRTNNRVAEGVVMLTREENVMHRDYILSFREKPLYTKVAKMADWVSNFYEMKKAQDRTWVNQAIGKRMPYIIEFINSENEISDFIQAHFLKGLIRAARYNNSVNLGRGVVATCAPEVIAQLQYILASKLNMPLIGALQRFHTWHRILAAQA